MDNLRFPLFVDIKGKTVLVVGGGRIATRRVKTLLLFQCNIVVVTLQACDELVQLQRNGNIVIFFREWTKTDLDNVFLVTTATDDRLVNCRVGEVARERGIYVSVADAKDESNFYFPAVATYQTAVVAIGSDGGDHRLVSGLAGKIRELDCNLTSKVLSNTKILVTSPNKSNSDIVTRLVELGADVDHIPAIDIIDIEFELPDVNDFTWIVFTSGSGVSVFFEKIIQLGFDSRIFSKNKFAVVGSKTAKTLSLYGIIPDFTPNSYNGESLITELSDRLTVDDNILLVRPKSDDFTLGEILREKEISFCELAIYKTEHIKINRVENLEHYDYVTFTSSSCVESFCKEIDRKKIKKAVCIGDKTANTAKKYNMSTLTAKNSTIELLVETIVEDRKKRSYEEDVRK